MTVQTLSLIQPDDWHAHFRDGAMLRTVLPLTARQCGRAIAMPNLKSPVTTTDKARAYRDEIKAALPAGSTFTPLMTLYMTDTTDADDLERGVAEGLVTAVKLYPANATTNSQFGVTDLGKLDAVFDRMTRLKVPLLMHGEVADPSVDIFDREAVFIEKVLHPLRQKFPALKIVFEHITTQQAADYLMAEGGATLGATVTAHHLIINRNALFTGGLRPHHYCMPIAKREHHRQALVKAVTSGKPVFFMGTDTAPHPRTAKESACGCAGVFTAANALELYAQVFDEAGALDKLEAFTSLNGPAFYGLAPNPRRVTLEKGAEALPALAPLAVPGGEGVEVLPFMPPAGLFWRFVAVA